MVLYSFATLRSVKQRMPQLHDHLWDMNVRFPKIPVNVSWPREGHLKTYDIYIYIYISYIMNHTLYLIYIYYI